MSLNGEKRDQPPYPTAAKRLHSTRCSFGRLGMLAYRVIVNGNHVATVGMKEDGLLFLKASWMRLKDADGLSFPDEGDAVFTISGLRDKTDEHLDWYFKELTLGDKIMLELVETDIVDAPTKVERKST